MRLWCIQHFILSLLIDLQGKLVTFIQNLLAMLKTFIKFLFQSGQKNVKPGITTSIWPERPWTTSLSKAAPTLVHFRFFNCSKIIASYLMDFQLPELVLRLDLTRRLYLRSHQLSVDKPWTKCDHSNLFPKCKAKLSGVKLNGSTLYRFPHLP